MKKIYIAPEVKEHKMKLRHMLCDSLEIDNETTATEDSEVGAKDNDDEFGW